MFDEHIAEQKEWLANLIAGITDEWHTLRPSDWSEQKRYMPRSASPMPGPFSFDNTPYWREVVDCFDADSDVRFVAVQKGAQVGATVAVLENIVGYFIDHVRTAPMLFFTADAELAQLRLDTAIMPMLQASNMTHLIQANDELRAGKRGATNKKLEWAGGGYLLPLGAVNANKQRSLSAPILLRDEVSGWPLVVGRDGDPMKLTETRTNSYELTRRILDLSTPNVKETCAITKRYELGDKRVFMVPCKHCGEFQHLRFRGRTDEGAFYGLRWEMEDGRIASGSVRYVCRHCSGEMINEDKTRFMTEGFWKATQKASRPDFRSYHLSALYSPVFARTWDAIAAAWQEAWDDENNVAVDTEKLQVFYNNDLGEAFEVKADRIKFHQVSPHRRSEYKMGQVPDRHAIAHTGGRIELITMAVDVQATWLSVAVFAWAPSFDNSGYAAYLVDYFNIQGDTENPESGAWTDLAEIIDNRVYKTAEGREFRPAVTAIDSGFRTDAVYQFCNQWESGVFPLHGRDKPLKAGRMREFNIMESSAGVRYFAITVDLYKDRWSAALKRQWNGMDKMPRNLLSVPGDTPDKALNELTVEFVREKRDPQSGKLLGTYWHRPGGSRNELWDLMVYNTAALEILAHDICVNGLGIEALLFGEFWAEVSDGRFCEKDIDG